MSLPNPRCARALPAALSFVALFSFALIDIPRAAASDFDPAVWYFKERRPLALDTSRIAIFAESDRATSGLRESVATVLPAHTSIEGSTVRGWQTAVIPDGLGSAEDVVAAVDALMLWPEQYVTPVFANEYGPLFPMPWILVQFAGRTDELAVEAILAGADARALAIEPFGGLPNAYRVRSAHRNGIEILNAAERLAQRDDVIFAEPDMLARGRLEFFPNDPLFGEQWGLLNVGQFGGVVDMDMDADTAWDQTTGSASVIVLILDVGVQQDHPDLNQVPGFDGTGEGSGGGPGNDCDSHGTCVAGCVAAIVNNGIGVAGVAPGVKVASGRLARTTAACSNAIDYTATWHVNALAFGESIGARVSNASIGVGSSSSVTSKYQQTRANGMVHFASAGNSGVASIGYPASLTTVQAVAALDPDGTLTSFSNSGNGLDVSAPGISVMTTDRTGALGYSFGDYTSIQGTSFSSPYAAAVAALVISAFPSFTAAQVEEAVQLTCVDLGGDGYDTTFGWGCVNARNAINFVAAAPGAFTRTAPAAGASGVSRLPTFQWSASAGAVSYRLVVDDNPDFSSPLLLVPRVSETSYASVGALLPAQTTLYWSVRAVNTFGTLDVSPVLASFTTFADCNNNNQEDAAEVAGNPALDCNGNGRIDSCDVSGGFTPDCNANGIPDSCDITQCAGSPSCGDCNGNGIPDACDIESGAAFDCNHNLTPDACDMALCNGEPFCSDCNENGVIDACDLAADFEAQSPVLAPLGTGFPQAFAIPAPRPAIGDVLFSFTAMGDLSAANETVSVTLNGAAVGTLWVTGGFDCTQVSATLTMTPAAYNTAIGGGGDAILLMTPSPSVSPTPAGCTGQTFIRARIDYVGTSTSADDNDDGVPDECNAPGGCHGDADCSGAVDFFDIDPFVAKLGCPGSDPVVCAAGCPWQNADADNDGDVDFFDIDPFVARLGQSCP